MDDTSTTLLLTRPKPQSETFLAECETEVGRRLPVVISPLLKIEPVGDMPDLDAFDTIVLTSSNGVARLGSALAGRIVVTVGKKTAALASQQGAKAAVLGESVDAFLAAQYAFKGRVLFCRGKHSRGDLANRLRQRSVNVEEAVIYDQVGQPLDSRARELLVGDGLVVAPVFSPRSARLLAANPITAPISVLAISSAVAAAWNGPGNILVASHPDANHMRQMVQEAF